MKYRIPVTVIVLGELDVEADSFAEAKLAAMEMADDEWQNMDPNECSVPEHVTEAMCKR